MERLLHYFTEGVKSCILSGKIGAEIETSFTDEAGKPISITQSQKMLQIFANRYGEILQKKDTLIAEIRDDKGNRLLYELGRQNIELATIPMQREKLIPETREILGRLYHIGREIGANPCFQPILETADDLLIVPDERDAGWIRIDGREALKPIARISSVQFTIPVCLDEAIICLNRLGAQISMFRQFYPQDSIWRRYIEKSHAKYHCQRYGGPIFFQNLEDYCQKLALHNFVDIRKNRLIPISRIRNLYIPTYIRSIWWYFRLKRYGDQLCIEVRPLGRYHDDQLETQLKNAMDIMIFGKTSLITPQAETFNKKSLDNILALGNVVTHRHTGGGCEH